MTTINSHIYRLISIMVNMIHILSNTIQDNNNQFKEVNLITHRGRRIRHSNNIHLVEEDIKIKTIINNSNNTQTIIGIEEDFVN